MLESLKKALTARIKKAWPNVSDVVDTKQGVDFLLKGKAVKVQFFTNYLLVSVAENQATTFYLKSDRSAGPIVDRALGEVKALARYGRSTLWTKDRNGSGFVLSPKARKMLANIRQRDE